MEIYESDAGRTAPLYSKFTGKNEEFKFSSKMEIYAIKFQQGIAVVGRTRVDTKDSQDGKAFSEL